MKINQNFLRSGALALVATVALSSQIGFTQENFNESDEPSPALRLKALKASLSARNQVVALIENKDLNGLANLPLRPLVEEIAVALREQNAHEQADALRREFEVVEKQAKDLGDHRPLSKWLAAKYVELERILGSAVHTIPLLRDLYILNYSIPVVVAPKLNTATGQEWGWLEYRKHFIPISEVIVYYVSKIACNQYLAQQGMSNNQTKKLCDRAATELKNITGRYLAPKASDFVYRAFNQDNYPNQFSPTRRELVYQNEDEFDLSLSRL